MGKGAPFSVKHQYFGDINDYLKYGLLRCFSQAGLRIGVCWMLTPDDGLNDGGKTRYLSDPRRWRGHDPALFDSLKSTVGSGSERHVSIAEDSGVIPNASFFSELVPDAPTSRDAWFARARAALSKVDLLFFDPDNGLEIRSKPYGSKDSKKYVYWSEVRAAWEDGSSLLIFQHFPREKRDPYVERVAKSLTVHAPGATVVSFRTPSVLFLLASQPRHRLAAEQAIDLARVNWHGPTTVDEPCTQSVSP